jgi:hypothetical protein
MRTAIRTIPRGSLHQLAAMLVIGVALAWSVHSHAQGAGSAPTQTTSAQGVEVKVTPMAWASGSAAWDFAVVLDTHSGALDDDLTKTAVLAVNGQEFTPTGWSGAAAGGHHREGVLHFPAPAELAGLVELRLRRAGESEARFFRWDAGELR